MSPTERARLEYDADRSDFEEWISRGTVPKDDRDVIQVESLQDLVDVAIDAERRVIEADNEGVFVVIVDDVRYVFEPDEFVRG